MSRPGPDPEQTTSFAAVPPTRKRRRRWPWIVLGVFALLGIIGALNQPATPAPAPTAAAPAPPAAPVPTPDAAPAPVSTPDSSDTADAAQSARQACSGWSTRVDPVITAAVRGDDLAPAIRVSMGEDPNATTAEESASAPWPAAETAAINAASDDPRYQPIEDAITATQRTIVAADPGGDLTPISAASTTVIKRCATLGAR